MNSSEINELQDLLAKPRKIVVVPHRNPDGDAIGSCLALHQFLTARGHHSHLIAPNDYPEFLKWLPGESEVIKYDQQREKSDDLLKEAEFIFTLDFNSFSRTGDMAEVLGKCNATFVMIDHHQQPDTYAKFMSSNVESSSTCQMIYHFIEKFDAVDEITPDIATCLYTGIMTDTGSFRFPSTTSDTHRVIANLIDCGAKNSSIHQKILDTNSIEKIQLLGVALENMRVIEGCRTAYITLSQKELDNHHFKKGDTEGFVNYGLSLKGIVFAAIFIENKAENIVKISLRSKGDFDVNQFSRTHFQGGGHKNAAGGKSDDSLVETVNYFEKTVTDCKKVLQNI